MVWLFEFFNTILIFRESICEELETELSDNKLELQKLQSKNDVSDFS